MTHYDQRWWFPKREFGFGWGPPTCWQGWITLLVFITAMALGLPLVGPELGRHGQLLVAGILTGGLLAVLLWKGEPLRSSPDESEPGD